LNQQQGEKLYRQEANSSYQTTLFLLLKIYPISANRISCSCTMKRWETNHGKRSWISRNEFNFHWLAIASTPDAGGFRLKEEQ
ncbi:MAG: hypothetical protein Q3X95_02870, partial [Duodenibacillus sp.]|nr:hypothetical protein [Duodenibacillus sp.]